MPDYYAPDEAGRLLLTHAARNRLKLAARELRRLTGLTLEDIAARSPVSKSQWQNYESLEAPDLIPPHVYLPWELELGQAPVTRALAAMNGLSVLTEGQSKRRAKLGELAAHAAREQGEALATLIDVALDGEISRNEAKQLDVEFADVERVAGEVRALASEIIAGKD
ncbi:transcriptional regulator with XRE-family HTH domain [Microvirga flocculans]|uniref:Transcriptional regulator with XRE-family HTH domain n=1 Tax=Microvirga flocculans TaxID=217168 RepID=A0A7W6IIC5_9HYPH|nr:hypothetical protein [Microvirga flocculans]MBB4042035.1 transcriptional regulator with XRE-family HTH domain [Microvirga flocculans]